MHLVNNSTFNVRGGSLTQVFKKFRKLKCRDFKKLEFCKATKLLIPILEYAESLEFKEQPDYMKLKHLLNSICLGIDQEPMKYFNWKKKACDHFQDIKESSNKVDANLFFSLEVDDM